MFYVPIAILALTLATSGASAQVRKCVGANGKVTYSDFICETNTSKEQEVKTNANTIDGSVYKKEAQKARTDAIAEKATEDARATTACKFSSYALGDKKGKELADAAREECISNAAAKANGGQGKTDAYQTWKDHRQLKISERSALVNSTKTLNCTPNGFGGMRCN